jgi:hypothetical protein
MNKIISICAGHDTGKFVLIDLIGNIQNIYIHDYIGDLFNVYKRIDPVLDIVKKDKNCRQLIKSINKSQNQKILLLTWHHILDLIKYVNVIPIFLFRDIRIGWFITEHKRIGNKQYYKLSIDEYIKKHMDVFFTFKSLINNDVQFYLFEDFLTNKYKVSKKVCDFLEIDFDKSFVPSFFKQKNKFISMFDVEKIIKFQKNITDDQLEYISSKTREFSHFFNYPVSLTKEQILEGF